MIPYFVLLIGIAFFGYLLQLDKNSIKFYFLIFLVLWLFAGLRNSSVGTDTHTYINAFYNINIFPNFTYTDNPSKIEVGYLVLQNIAKYFSTSYVSLLLTSAFLVLIFQILSIHKLSVLPLVSFIVLLTMGFYTFSFNGIRQALAASIYLYSYQFIINGNFKKYVFWIFIGMLFHKTIIISLPLYFIFRQKFSFKLFFILLIVSLLSSLFFQDLLNIGTMISDKYSVYLESEEKGGKLLTLFYVILSLFFVMVRYNIKRTYIKQYDIYLNIFLVGTMIYLSVYISNAYVEITRLAFYFLMSTVFIWPIIFRSIRRKYLPMIVIFFIVIHLLFYTIYLNKIAGLIPYELNSELF